MDIHQRQAQPISKNYNNNRFNKNYGNNYKKPFKPKITIEKEIQETIVFLLENFFPKIDYDYTQTNVEIQQTKIHFYGIDYLGQTAIQKYVDIYNPQKLEWINDSSCNIVFENATIAEKALNSLKLSQFEIKQDGLNPWIQILPYRVQDSKGNNIQREVFVRFATNLDIQSQGHYGGLNSSFYKNCILQSGHQYIPHKKREPGIQQQSRDKKNDEDDEDDSSQENNKEEEEGQQQKQLETNNSLGNDQDTAGEQPANEIHSKAEVPQANPNLKDENAIVNESKIDIEEEMPYEL